MPTRRQPHPDRYRPGRHLVLGTGLFLGLLLGLLPTGSRALVASLSDVAPADVAPPSPGITATEIVLGQSCALSGPSRYMGRDFRSGLLACFAEVNSAGGINGRLVRLISRDDRYEPTRAIKNTRKLIDEDEVFLLIGPVGTPTSQAVVPMIEARGVPYFGPFSGAEFLRDPFRKYVVNVRASYHQEMEAICAYLVEQRGFERIACFYQNDGYGQSGLEGTRRALAKRGLPLVAEGTYERNTTAVKNSLLRIRKSRPEAIVMVGAYQPCAEFIKLARRTLPRQPMYCNISSVGSEALLRELGPDGEGCLISQVVQDPHDRRVPIVDDFNNAMDAHQEPADKGFIALEGYLVGRLFCRIMERIPGEPTREAFLEAVTSGAIFDLGGVILEFGPEDHQGMDQVFSDDHKGRAGRCPGPALAGR